MQFPLNLVLEIRTQKEYDRLQETLQLLRDAIKPLSTQVRASNTTLLDRIVMRLADANKESRVLINGRPIATGTIEEMVARYNTEKGMHQKSNIVLEEWKNGNYTATRSRRLQKF